MRYGRRATILAAAVMGVGLGATQAMAANITWSGGGDGTSWTDTDNWVGGVVPGDQNGAASINEDTAIFNATGVAFPNITVDAGRTIQGITTGAGYTIGSTSGNAITLVGGGTVTGNEGTIAAPIVLASNPSFNNNANQVLDINGDISTVDATARSLRLQNSWGTVNFNGEISGPITIVPNVQFLTGQRIINLNHSNTNTGGVSHNHSIAIVHLNAAGAITDSRAETGRGGHFVVNAENAITGSSYVTIRDGENGTYPSTIVFNHPNDYTGTTTIGIGRGWTGGELWANNTHGSATGSGDVSISGGLLAGDGFIVNTGEGRGVTLGASGRIGPGASVGEIGTLTLSTGDKGLGISGAVGSANLGSLIFDLDTSTNSDRVDLLAGVLNIGSGVLEFDDFAFNPLSGFGVGEYTLFNTNAAINGTLGENLSGSIGDFTGTIGFSGDGQDLILTVVPEPSVLGALAIGAIGLMARRRRVA